MGRQSLSDQSLDLNECDREKIHLIGEVQSLGSLFVVSLPDFKITMASENIIQLPGIAVVNVNEAQGQTLDCVIPSDLANLIYQKYKAGMLRTGAHSFEWCEDRGLDVFFYSLGTDRVVIEITPLLSNGPETSKSNQSSEELMRNFLSEMKHAEDSADLGRLVCRAVRASTHLDRVMLYQFGKNWNGDVIAEDRAVSVHAFLHHKFPASDIPKPARDLYLRNQVRFIYDSADSASPILPRVDAAFRNEIDLSDSRLRAVSKIHLEYLRNMGVSTSFSIAVTVRGKLWGLIAAHGNEKIYISHSVRAICQSLADTLALAVGLLEERNEKVAELDFHARLMSLFQKVQGAPNPTSELFKQFEAINSLFGAQGFAVIGDGQSAFAGITPPLKDLVRLREKLAPLLRSEKDGVIAINELAELDESFRPLAHLASGVLCVALPYYHRSLLMIFRPEHIRTIQWGGDPRKQFSSRNYQGTINPRASFESWTETVKHTSLPWSAHEIRGIGFFKSMIFDALINHQQLINELRESLKRKSSS